MREVLLYRLSVAVRDGKETEDRTPNRSPSTRHETMVLGVSVPFRITFSGQGPTETGSTAEEGVVSVLGVHDFRRFRVYISLYLFSTHTLPSLFTRTVEGVVNWTILPVPGSDTKGVGGVRRGPYWWVVGGYSFIRGFETRKRVRRSRKKGNVGIR